MDNQKHKKDEDEEKVKLLPFHKRVNIKQLIGGIIGYMLISLAMAALIYVMVQCAETLLH